MNSLSWLLYAADVSNNVGVFLGIVGGVGSIGSLVVGLFSAIEGEFENVWPYLKVVVSIAGASLLISCAIPSKTTVYAIAASEMGEKALNTQTGGKAVQALNAWLDRQITPDKSHD